MADRHFRWWLAGIAAVALGVRVAYILLARQDYVPGGDAFFFHSGAQLLVEGRGFIDPHIYADTGTAVQAANHPPLYVLWLAIPSAVGATSPISHMLWSAVLGTGTVVVVGLLGREVAGPRAGAIAAGLAAVYPNIWGHDGMVVSETMAIFWASAAVLLAYRYWKEPTVGRLALLAVGCALAALSRAELVLLLPLVVLPLVLLTRREAAERVRGLAVAALAALLALGPWAAFNLARIDEPVVLTSGLEVTLATANCEETWYGNFTGYWNLGCAREAEERSGIPGASREVNADAYRSEALSFIGDNLERLPVVVAARLGRVTGLYRPLQQVNLDSVPEGRDQWVARLSLAMYYPIAGLAVAGAVVLRRRREVPVFPLVALPAIVLITTALAFGTNRYRATAEGALVVLAAVAIDAAVVALARRRRRQAEAEAETDLAVGSAAAR